MQLWMTSHGKFVYLCTLDERWKRADSYQTNLNNPKQCTKLERALSKIPKKQSEMLETKRVLLQNA